MTNYIFIKIYIIYIHLKYGKDNFEIISLFFLILLKIKILFK